MVCGCRGGGGGGGEGVGEGGVGGREGEERRVCRGGSREVSRGGEREGVRRKGSEVDILQHELGE